MVGRWHFLLTWSLFSHQVYCNARAGYFFGRNMFANVPNGGWLEKFQIIFSNMFRFAPRPLERLYVCFAPRVPADDFCVSTLWDVSPRSHWIKEPTCSWWSWRWWVWSLERLLTIKIKKAPVIDGCTVLLNILVPILRSQKLYPPGNFELPNIWNCRNAP